MERIKEYIAFSWLRVVTPRDYEPDFILPHDYVPPGGDFLNLFYWDTFFTNLGLLLDGHAHLARNNVNNLLHCLEIFGCVPNYTRKDGASWCSQPPYLALMVKSIEKFQPNPEWLENVFPLLEMEYSFWQEKRSAPNGLNRYGTNQKDENKLLEYFDYVADRLQVTEEFTHFEKNERAVHYIAEAESGEDFTPRFLSCCHDYNPLDLNCHLYNYEKLLAHFSRKLGLAEKAVHYLNNSEKRLNLINSLCLDPETGIYYDYDYRERRRSSLVSAAAFMPFAYGISSDARALKNVLGKLQFFYGIVSCEPVSSQITYQWGYPNSWAPNNYWAHAACLALGMEEEAKKIAKSYMATVKKNFEKTGKLWEKYDAVKGDVATANEYAITEMFGWTAGVFRHFFDQLLGEVST